MLSTSLQFRSNTYLYDLTYISESSNAVEIASYLEHDNQLKLMCYFLLMKINQ